MRRRHCYYYVAFTERRYDTRLSLPRHAAFTLHMRVYIITPAAIFYACHAAVDIACRRACCDGAVVVVMMMNDVLAVY